MVKPSCSPRACSSKKRKRETETETTEVEEISCISLLRPCSSNERREIINDDVEEEKQKKKQEQEQEQNIDGDGGCKIIADFLCAEELGKQSLLCGGRYHRYHTSNVKEVSVRQVMLHTKNVGILFVNLTNSNTNKKLHFLRPLKEIYYKLRQQHGPDAFEIVFVAIFSPRSRPPLTTETYETIKEDIFNSHLKQMPWLAVPFHDDQNWRKHLIKRYNQEPSGHNSDLMLFGPNGNILQHNSGEGLEDLINFFGPDLYPFTEAKQKELIDKYFAPLRSPNKSLKDLLGRDFLISYGDGDEDYKRIPISQLQGKVVGLYFFHEEPEKHHNRDLMRKLEDFRLRAYSERGSSFEIVFINVDFESGYSSERSFRRFLKKWPWLLALPFKDDKIRGLCYTLSIGDSLNSLVIIDESGDGFRIEPHSYNIIQEYGFDAYPFTRDMATETAKKRLTQLTLADFFKATRTELLRPCKAGKPYKPLSFLENKRVLLYVATSSRRREIKKLLDLQKKDRSFEVLVFGLRNIKRSTRNAMPKNWLALSPGVRSWELTEKIIKVDIDCSNILIAFDDTGKLLKMGGTGLLKKGGAAGFPYITDKIFDKEFREMMDHTKKWNYEVGENDDL